MVSYKEVHKAMLDKLQDAAAEIGAQIDDLHVELREIQHEARDRGWNQSRAKALTQLEARIRKLDVLHARLTKVIRAELDDEDLPQ